jgi:hypothetical protein
MSFLAKPISKPDFYYILDVLFLPPNHGLPLLAEFKLDEHGRRKFHPSTHIQAETHAFPPHLRSAPRIVTDEDDESDDDGMPRQPFWPIHPSPKREVNDSKDAKVSKKDSNSPSTNNITTTATTATVMSPSSNTSSTVTSSSSSDAIPTTVIATNTTAISSSSSPMIIQSSNA